MRLKGKPITKNKKGKPMCWIEIQKKAKIVLITTLLTFLGILASASSTESKVPPKLAPDMVFHHGKIITVDKNFSLAEAVAIKEEKFIAVGKNEDILELAGDKTWLDARVMVVGGSDAGIPPLQGIYACVTRKNVLGETLGPNQAISREDALKLYTINAAYASFEENIKGSIEEGKLADLVVLSDDLLIVPEDKIKDIQVLTTVVGGRIVFEKNN